MHNYNPEQQLQREAGACRQFKIKCILLFTLIISKVWKMEIGSVSQAVKQKNRQF